MKRRLGLAGASLALAVAAAAPALPSDLADKTANMALGRPGAKVTVVEYASLGCPHCARWARSVFPAFKARYVDTGEVRFVFHELLAGNASLAAAGFLTARCATPDKYFQVVDAVFARQAEVAEHGAPELLAIARAAGLDEAAFTACLNDEAALKAMGERTEADALQHKVSGTPTFFVDDHKGGEQKLEGEQSLANLGAAIARARR